jgi:hypothetical protein
MGRLIAVITAFTLLSPAAPAAAAELTRVISSGEPDHAFGLDLSLRWDRTQKRASITREYMDVTGGSATPFGDLKELQQLRYTETSNVIVPRVVFGLWEDLQLQFELPYYLSQETTWRRAAGVGVPALPDTISGNMLDPDGNRYASGTHPLFPVDGSQTVFHGSATGDLKVGLSWAPFAQKRDDTKPTWVVGLELTLPTAKLYDPVLDRNQYWESPYSVAAKTGPVGQKVWRYTFQTAMSRHLGPIDPYLKASLTLMQKSSSTYSNCDHAADLVTPPVAGADPQLKAGADVACAANPDRWGAKLPKLASLTFGTELVPYEEAATNQKIALDLRVTADYTSASRWYNELTDATGKLLATEASMTFTGRVGVIFRASEYVSVQAAGSLGWVTPHYLTGEDLSSAAANPNFDWRYDAPGRRFRATSGSVFDLQVSGLLAF